MPEQIKLVERETFVVAAKDGATEGLAIRKAYAAEMKAFDLETRTIDFIISTAAVDRMNDSVAVAGWDYEAYLRSPVVLWCHDSSQPPVGKALSVSTGKDALLSKAEFMDRDLSPFADSVFRMYMGKFLSAVSVGFIPKSYSFSSDKGREFGVDFKTQELLEYSCCPVPANPEALVAARAAGIDTGPIREWASKLLDEGNQILVPRNLLEETFRQAKTPRTVRQKYLAKSEIADWKVDALDDLPLADVEAWDGAAAAKRMLDDAGFDGDTPDVAKAARGFLIHDAANPVLRSSYKLPFADIINGELKAIKSGVIAAKGRIDQSDAPEAIRAEAKEIAGEYESKTISTETIVETIIDPVERAGRKISNANAALLQQAMDHHASATKCIKDVLDGNTTADPDDDNDQDPIVDDSVPTVTVLSAEDLREQRLIEARALRASVKI